MKLSIHKRFLGGLLTGTLLGLLISVALVKATNQKSTDTVGAVGAIRETIKETPLIKPLLAYNSPEAKTLSPLKDSLKELIGKRDPTISAVSLYYKDLTTGKWFGINQDETYTPASLFKVPLMIAYLKYSEKYPELLSTKVYNDLQDDENKNETIKPLKSIVKGQSYTIEELLRYMIEFSDNNATTLLFKHIDQETLKQVFSDLDIELPTAETNSNFISVSNYSFLFRVLYNATYLSHEMSEKGLEMLSKIDFEDGIRKKLPSSVTVADKFGEYYTLGNSEGREYQLHDCGIIYHKEHPYILCIMTKGNSFEALKGVIQTLSKTIYDELDSSLVKNTEL